MKNKMSKENERKTSIGIEADGKQWLIYLAIQYAVVVHLVEYTPR